MHTATIALFEMQSTTPEGKYVSQMANSLACHRLQLGTGKMLLIADGAHSRPEWETAKYLLPNPFVKGLS